MKKLITVSQSLTFREDEQHDMMGEWNDYKAHEESTYFLVCGLHEDPDTQGVQYFNLRSAKKAAGWLEE